ncbi:hypothetical protein GCM10022197_13090 [Microlunatus spumicola]|uniref:Uncharacterized protein n=1 Tax=Microlunatus spumicola TaxID=81499 RepID=A0ABP6X202_9ACTN
MITTVSSSGGEKAYCDIGPKGQASSSIRSDPLTRSTTSATAASTRQARDPRLTGRTSDPLTSAIEARVGLRARERDRLCTEFGAQPASLSDEV